MNLPIAVPGHVGEDGVWLEFVAPDGKRLAINIAAIARHKYSFDLEGRELETLGAWADAHMAAYRAVNKG